MLPPQQIVAASHKTAIRILELTNNRYSLMQFLCQYFKVLSTLLNQQVVLLLLYLFLCHDRKTNFNEFVTTYLGKRCIL